MKRPGAVSDAEPLHLLLSSKLRRYDEVSELEIDAIAHAVRGARSFDPGQDIAREEDRPPFSSLLVEGWAARTKTLTGGARQITSLHIPGDYVDLHSFLLLKMDHSVVALTRCRTVDTPHENLRALSQEQPHLTRLLWLNTLVDAAIHRNWIVALGRLTAAERLAQLVCEMYSRLAAVDLARDNEFEFPLTQVVLADVLGLSLVHVNRTLREIRERKLVSWRSRSVKILDWDALVEFAQFDPTYLSIRREPR